MAMLKVGDIRRFNMGMNFFDAVIVNVDRKHSCYDVIDSTGLKRSVPFGSVVGKGSVPSDKRELFLRVVREYQAVIEAYKYIEKYENEVKKHSAEVVKIQSELGYEGMNKYFEG